VDGASTAIKIEWRHRNLAGLSVLFGLAMLREENRLLAKISGQHAGIARADNV
jgi:hypothetical protein